MRLTTRPIARGGARRWSRPAPILLLLLGAALLAGGVRHAVQGPSATVVDSRDLAVAESGSSSAVAPGPVPGTPVSRTPPVPSTLPVPDTPSAAGPTAPVAIAQAPPGTVSLPGRKEPMPVVPVGVLPSKALQLPEHPKTLGWWSSGPLPGSSQGTVVLAGHLDSAQHGVGPLDVLLADDFGGHIDVVDTAGAVHRYTASARRSYPSSALPADLFAGTGPPRLALVTCGGLFDERTGGYSDNVVVLADPVATS